MVTLSKIEAKERMVEEGLCDYHANIQPDQRASMETCEDCIIIEDPCGCRLEDECEDCHPEKFEVSEYDQALEDNDPVR